MNRIFKILIVLMLAIPFANAQQADSIPPMVQLDTAVLAIGDQTHLRITLPVPKGKEAIFPDFKDKIGKSLEIIEKTIDTISRKDDLQIITHNYLITSFDTGYIFIPPFEIGLVENGFNSTITTDTAKMYVATPVVDMEKGIFDIKPPADLPFKFSEILPLIKKYGAIILAILAIVVLLLFYFIVYKKRKKKNMEVVDNRPADVKATEALLELKEKQLWQKNFVKVYYSELTDILRNYLDERYNMQTMESTSSEILRDIKDKNINSEEVANLKMLLEHADMAKFAKGEPLPDQNDRSWNDAFQFIQKTKLWDMAREVKDKEGISES